MPSCSNQLTDALHAPSPAEMLHATKCRLRYKEILPMPLGRVQPVVGAALAFKRSPSRTGYNKALALLADESVNGGMTSMIAELADHSMCSTYAVQASTKGWCAVRNETCRRSNSSQRFVLTVNDYMHRLIANQDRTFVSVAWMHQLSHSDTPAHSGMTKAYTGAKLLPDQLYSFLVDYIASKEIPT